MAYMDRGDSTDLPSLLKRARKAAGFSNAKDFLAAVKASEGQAPSYSTYAQWESSQVAPRDESLAPIRSFHDAKGTWPASAETRDELIEALRSQTAAISELAAQVKALVAVQPAPTELASALVELVRSGLLAGEPAGRRVGGLPRS